MSYIAFMWPSRQNNTTTPTIAEAVGPAKR